MDFKHIFKKCEACESGFLSVVKLRDCMILALCAALAYRLAVSEVKIDLSGFGFTDLVSLILAVSAVGLSAAFYFKADESSKKFYNDSYEFTKNINVLLGRIEERFGAQLSDITKRFDSEQFVSQRLREGVAKEIGGIIDKNEDGYKKIIEELIAGTKMEEAQIDLMKERMTQLQQETEQAKSELATSSVSLSDGTINPLAMSDYFLSRVKDVVRTHFNPARRYSSPLLIPIHFKRLADSGLLEPWLLDEFKKLDLMSGDQLNEKGIELIGKMFES